MSARLVVCAFLMGSCLAPSLAAADGFYIPGVSPDDRVPRPTYRQADRQFPPPGGRYGGGFIEYVLTGGRPEPIAPQYVGSAAPNWVKPAYARPGDPPPGGTADTNPIRAWRNSGLLPEPTQPIYAVGVNPARASLPPGGLPDYAPQAMVGASPVVYGQPAAYAADPNAGAMAAEAAAAGRPMDPVFLRQVVAYSGHERPGTIIIDTPDKFLYLVEADGHAIRYGIGVGRPGFTWSGVKRISRKAEWPGWTPPSQMLKRRPDLPRHMVGGEANPLGARAMYLGSSMYRIHGTNEPYTIGMNVSSGCIRMMNADVIDLYNRVNVGARVVVL